MKIHQPQKTYINPEAQIGKGTVIHPGAIIYDNVVIGRNCKIQAGVILVPGVVAEDNVFFGPGVITTNDPKIDGNFKKTYIKKGAKLGAGCKILAGVTIEEDALIGMGACILQDVPKGIRILPNTTF